MKDLQELVQDSIDELVSSGAETGLQVAVYRDGELVVDAVAYQPTWRPGDPSPRTRSSTRLPP